MTVQTQTNTNTLLTATLNATLSTILSTGLNTTRTLGLGALAALFILSACGGGSPASTDTEIPGDIPIDAPIDDLGDNLMDDLTDDLTDGETPNDGTTDETPNDDTTDETPNDDTTDDTTDETPNDGTDSNDGTNDDTTTIEPDTSCANPANANQRACIIAATCPGDPYNAVCFDDGTYASARDAFTLLETCTNNPFDPVCYADDTYAADRAAKAPEICPYAPFNPVCYEDDSYQGYRDAETTLIACTTNPFDEVCYADDTYNAIRAFLTCPADPFNEICFEDDTYLDARVAKADEICPTDPLNVVCFLDDTYEPQRAALAIAETCTNDPFASVCYADETYTADRAALAAEFCPDDPFNGYCFGDDSYEAARNAIIIAETCPTDPFNAICYADYTYADDRAAIAAEICPDDPFNAYCFEGNLYDSARSAIVTADTCTADPFNAICFEDDTYTDARNALTLIATCMADPFNAACLDNSDYDDARTTKVATTCPADPFNAICLDNPDYDDERTAKIPEICTADPFDALCFDGTTYDAPRSEVIATCATDSTSPACTEALNRPNYATYLQSFDAALPTNLDTAFEDFNFTQIGESGVLDTSSLIQNIFLNEGTVTRAGDSRDGFYYVLGQNSTNGFNVATSGILQTTDLGAPLANTEQTVVWSGSYFHPWLKRVYSTNFTIDMGAGTITTDGNYIAFRRYAEFDLNFDAKGLISGTVDLISNPTPNTPTDPADLTIDTTTAVGVIGQEGLVGVFGNIDATRNPYFGGFVASNSALDDVVSYADWVEGATPALHADTTARNEFLQTERFFDGSSGGRHFIVTLPATSNRYEQLFDLNGTTVGLSGNNAVSLGVARGEDGRHYYAGLNYGTSLGAPLVETTGAAVWNGWAYVLDGTPTNTAIEVLVDFDNSGISAFFSKAENTKHYLLEGSFDDRGVITGRAVRADFAGGVRTGAVTGAVNGSLTGLIGTDGAVGAFVGGGVSGDGDPLDGFAGGFVARPN